MARAMADQFSGAASLIGDAFPEDKPAPSKPSSVNEFDRAASLVNESFAPQELKKTEEASRQDKTFIGKTLDEAVGINRLLSDSFTGAKETAAYWLTRPFKSAKESSQIASEAARAPDPLLGKVLPSLPERKDDELSVVEKQMQFIGEHIQKGAKWIANKTGIPESDVEQAMNALGITGLPGLGKAAAPAERALTAGTKSVSKGIETTKKAVGIPETKLSGAGAAEVKVAKQRQDRANELPIPIKLSKDQLTRNSQDVRFARETAKTPLGEQFQEHYANQNKQIQDNLKIFVDETQSEWAGMPQVNVGENFLKVIEDAKQTRKNEYNALYALAERSGEMAGLHSYRSLLGYINHIEKRRPTTFNQNPILRQVREELAASDPKGTGKIDLNQLEDIRKLIIEETEPGTPNGFHGNKLIVALDKVTEKVQGNKYRQARKAFADYKREFYDTPVIRDAWSLKKGTNERKVPLEKLAEHLTESGGAERLAAVLKSLEKLPEGAQLKRELQGQVAQRILDEAIKGVTLDINGLPYVSTANLNRIIQKYDKGGRLDVLFGKKRAEQFRTLNEVVKDIQTTPKDTTNPSGTAATILGAMVEGAGYPILGMTDAALGVPVVTGLTAAGRFGLNVYKQNRTLNKISDFINITPEQIAKEKK